MHVLLCNKILTYNSKKTLPPGNLIFQSVKTHTLVFVVLFRFDC